MHGEHLPLRITHFPKVDYGQGFLQHIIFDASGVSVLLKKDRKLTTRHVSELILAQVHPTSNSPFDLDTRRRIKQVLNKSTIGVKNIVLDLNQNFSVVLNSGKLIPLGDFLPQADSKECNNQNRNYFELEQVLGSYERGEIISYTHQEPTQSILAQYIIIPRIKN